MIKIILAKKEQEINDAFSIRGQVFIDEQGINKSIVFDEHDASADHFLIKLNNKPVGSLRVRYPQKGVAKIERLAVVQSLRGQRIGTKLIKFVLDYLKDKKIKKVTLDSQSYIKSLYEKLGFIKDGDEFEEVGISHVKMVKII